MTLRASIQKRVSQRFTLQADFAVPAGVTILFGASGAGKTTLLRCIAGLLRPDAGRILVGERVLLDTSSGVDLPASRRRIGYVFQDLALFPHLTVEGNVRYGLCRIDAAAGGERTQAILEAFRIAHLRTQRPSQISGGEQQRVALARSLVTDPCTLLLDEPLTGLDYVTQSNIMEDLRGWNAERRIPILYVTHAHREVFALGERVVVLEQGKILAQGVPQEVLEAPTAETVAQLAGFENVFDAQVLALRANAGTMQCRLAGAGTELEAPLHRVEPGAMVRLAIRAGDIMVATQPLRGLSARNLLPGTLTSLRREGPVVVAGVDAGTMFKVHLTPGACESLQLRAGQHVWLVIKTHSCRLVRPASR